MWYEIDECNIFSPYFDPHIALTTCDKLYSCVSAPIFDSVEECIRVLKLDIFLNIDAGFEIKHDDLIKCSQCGQNFDDDSHLKIHQYWHFAFQNDSSIPKNNQKRLFRCNECNVSFNRKCSLSRHKRKRKCSHNLTTRINKERITSECSEECTDSEQISSLMTKGKTLENNTRNNRSLTEFDSDELVSLTNSNGISERKESIQDNMCNDSVDHINETSNLDSPINVDNTELKDVMLQKGKSETTADYSSTEIYSDEECKMVQDYTENSHSNIQSLKSQTGNENPYQTFDGFHFLSEYELSTAAYHREMRSTNDMWRVKLISTPPPRFVCDICNRVFCKKNAITTHMRMHIKSNGPLPKFNCDVCERVFRQKQAMALHARMHIKANGSPPPKFICDVCERVFRQKQEMILHARKHIKSSDVTQSRFVCDICGLVFRKKSTIAKHVCKHERSLTCKRCGKKYSSAAMLKSHKREHWILCECGEQFTTLTAHTHHLKKQHPHTCDECNETVNGSRALREHKRSHYGYECSVCRKRFKSLYYEKVHMRMHEPSIMFACDVCGSRFVSQSGLRRHQNLHTWTKLWTCDVCDKRFSDDSNMRKHRKTHFERGTFACSQCDAKYSRIDKLTEHAASHKAGTTRTAPRKQKRISLSTRKWECACGRTFRQRYRYQEHLLVHSGAKDFECGVCAARFRIMRTLKRHVLTHLGADRPKFECEVCGIKKTRRHLLVEHTHKFHGTFVCNICDVTYSVRSKFIKHTKQHMPKPLKRNADS